MEGNEKGRRSFLGYGFLALVASVFGWIGGAIAQVKRLGEPVAVKAVGIYQKFRKMPMDAKTIENSPAFHFSTFHFAPDRASAGEAEIVKGAQQFAKEPGVSKVAVYKLVSGSPGAPTHIFAFIGKNPVAIRGLADKPQYKGIDGKLAGMVTKPIVHTGTNAKFIGKIG